MKKLTYLLLAIALFMPSFNYLQASEKPNFIIDNIEIVASTTDSNDYFSVTYKNIGGDVPQDSLRIEIEDSLTKTTYYQYIADQDFTAGYQGTMLMTTKVAPSYSGEHILKAQIDTLNNFDESNEDDNQYTKTIMISKPDLVIDSISMHNDNVARIYFSNTGHAQVDKSFKINVYDTETADNKQELVTERLGVGQQKYIDMGLYTGKHTLKATIDSGNNIDEFNEDNNIYQAELNSSPSNVINNINIDSIGKNQAIISWTTSEPTKSDILYGTTKTTDGMIYLSVDNNLTVTHQILIDKLEPNTKYYYQIQATTQMSKKSQSVINDFTTLSNASSQTTSPKPDFMIHNITIQKDEVLNAHYIYVDFENIGARSESKELYLEVIDQDTQQIYPQSFSAGNYNTQDRYNIVMYEPLARHGQDIYNLKARIDTTNNFAESDENNNTYTKQVSLNSGNIDNPAPHPEDYNFSKKLAGRLLLATQDHGRIYYINTASYQKHEVTFANLMDLFESLSLGITHADLEKIPDDQSMQNRLKGKLLLDVDMGGRIWYVAMDGTLWEITFANAMNLFESLALGITNADLARIPDTR